MSFNLHFAERPTAPRAPPHRWLSACFVVLLVALGALLIDAVLTGGTNVRGFHAAATRLVHRI
jgi:hypothetical protein